MKRRQLCMIELEPELKNTELNNNQEFTNHFQTAILLSLLENKQITKWQFDRCLEELKKNKPFIHWTNEA